MKAPTRQEMQMLREAEGIKINCPLCGRVCEDEQILMVHMEEYHKEVD